MCYLLGRPQHGLCALCSHCLCLMLTLISQGMKQPIILAELSQSILNPKEFRSFCCLEFKDLVPAPFSSRYAIFFRNLLKYYSWMANGFCIPRGFVKWHKLKRKCFSYLLFDVGAKSITLLISCGDRESSRYLTLSHMVMGIMGHDCPLVDTPLFLSISYGPFLWNGYIFLVI